jgi:hypothetical protein
MTIRQSSRIKKKTDKIFSTDSNEFSVDKPKRQPETLETKKSHRWALETEREIQYITNIPKLYKIDLGIINKPDLYPDNKKKDRSYNRPIERTLSDLKLFTFLLNWLKPRYRLKILKSTEFNTAVDTILQTFRTSSSEYNKEEKEIVLQIAMQMYESSLNVISKEMPKEFRSSLIRASEPLQDLLQAISDYSQNFKDGKVPKFTKHTLFKN